MHFSQRKVYGKSKTAFCPFCNRIATQKNKQGIDVCSKHLKLVLEEIKCTCGSWLEQRSGKFGPYFNCINCGNVNFRKGMEMKGLTKTKSSQLQPEKKELEKKTSPQERKEIVITSKDVEWFD